MPSDDDQTRRKTPAKAERAAQPVTPDQRFHRPEPKSVSEGLRVLYG